MSLSGDSFHETALGVHLIDLETLVEKRHFRGVLSCSITIVLSAQ